MRRRSAVSLLVVVCAGLGAGSLPSAQAGIIEGVNHTHWAINKFSVDGRSGLDTIGPWQRGGGGHFSMPARWTPGLTVQVDWETGVAFTDGIPRFEDSEIYEAWASAVRVQRRQHTKLIHVPEYDSKDVCGITVHFLPCEEIQITTSCYAYGHPQYPIKTPLKLPEPQSCPASATLSVQGDF